ncbi:2-amino-3-ketobutyrate coenzyme A ligase, mitochondrial [Sphaerodactylus townsendi]|uniref:2-amino-3-ketobutyrate coenzyme A ligase, mitochondrial n=1 Tax=Sphaerodactylus townsendi TaxID=933632 RepID=UPI002025CE3B|nr:2-amino-3-ketobutyrate coenzyme A ligase, mitochondrial [Sphaerodactylus townsendi]
MGTMLKRELTSFGSIPRQFLLHEQWPQECRDTDATFSATSHDCGGLQQPHVGKFSSLPGKANPLAQPHTAPTGGFSPAAFGWGCKPFIVRPSKGRIFKWQAAEANIHKDLEEKIARFHQREDAILYASCFDANAGIFEALLTPDDAVLSDELNHASIIDGIRLCKANKYRYKHMDMQDLESKLQDAQKHRLRLVATDGAFSMDGDIAPLKEICSLAQKYKAIVFVDECHATGFLGPNGRGTDELLGVMDQVAIINSTLGKALGGAAGGYTTGPKALIDLLRQRSRPYLFSNSLPPAVVGCASKALDLLMESNAIAQSMAAKTTRFRSKMAAAGFTISGNDHPICPVMLGDARLASLMADDMLKRGIYVIGFSYPVVPKGKARIRVQISAVHSEEDIDRCVETFIEVGRTHGALS